MAGKIAGTVLSLMLMTFLIFLITFYFMHMSIKESVNDINYSVSEVIATSGIFSESVFMDLKNSVQRFGDFFIQLKLEKQVEPGIYDTYYKEQEIIGQVLDVGDRVTIYLEDKNPSLFGRLINAAFLGHTPDKMVETGIKSMKTAIIAKAGKTQEEPGD